MKALLQLTLLLLVLPLQAAIDPAHYLKACPEVAEGMVIESSEMPGGKLGERKGIIILKIARVVRTEGRSEEGATVEIAYDLNGPRKPGAGPGVAGPQALYPPKLPDKGQQIRCYLKVEADPNGTERLVPGAWQYSFEPVK